MHLGEHAGQSHGVAGHPRRRLRRCHMCLIRALGGLHSENMVRDVGGELLVCLRSFPRVAQAYVSRVQPCGGGDESGGSAVGR